MHVTDREETVGGRTRNGVHEERGVRQSSLAAVARGQDTANAVVHSLEDRRTVRAK